VECAAFDLLDTFARPDRAPNTYRYAIALAMAFVSILAAGIALRTSLTPRRPRASTALRSRNRSNGSGANSFAALVIDQDSRLYAMYSQIYAGLKQEQLALQTEKDDDARASILLAVLQLELLRTLRQREALDLSHPSLPIIRSLIALTTSGLSAALQGTG
jgi:hypothetical protein